jgi:hypothetical protein
MYDEASLRGDYLGVSAEERQSLAALCSEYCWRVDNYASPAIPALFTDDGVWSAPGVRLRGRAELDAGWRAHLETAQTRTSRHQIGTMRFVRRSDGMIAGIIGFTVFSAPRDTRAPAAPLLAGEHRDVYRRDDGRWLFLSREVAPLFPNDWRPSGFPTQFAA